MKTIILYHSRREENFPDKDLPPSPALRQSAVARSKLTGFALHSTQRSENLPLETANLVLHGKPNESTLFGKGLPWDS